MSAASEEPKKQDSEAQLEANKVRPIPRPIVVQLAAGTYFWCACGESGHQPFCDGSHRTLEGTQAEPLRWKLDEDRKVALCTCKRTKTPPLCDGSHQEDT